MRDRRTPIVVAVAAVLSIGACSDRRQQQVAERGQEVMPFDLDTTTHAFAPSADGGTQTVTSDDPDDTQQIDAIRDHLRKEAAAFERGEFDDPLTVHGPDMPGVAQLSAGAARIDVIYDGVAAGARLTYATSDPKLIEALHAWFDAQTSDHGDHARQD